MNLKQLWPMTSIFAAAVMMQACNESVKWHTPPECKDEGHVWCNDGCIDPMTDNAFCGADALCEKFTACKDGKTCQNGECVGAGPVNHCEHGKVKCGEDCIDPMTDNDHCGADANCESFTACVDDKTCVGGECSTKPVDGKCPEGQVKCGEDCIDPQKNNAFCGADATCEHYDDCAKQGKTCESGECVGGEPVNECELGKVKCGEDCIDPMTDNDHCGANSSCLNYTACVDGKTCVGGECSAKPVDGKCPEGQVKCGESCIDPTSNADYCGVDENCLNGTQCSKWLMKCENRTCVATEFEPNGCPLGHVKCGEACVFPSNSQFFCGADENCENYTNCGEMVCNQGKCEIPSYMQECGANSSEANACYVTQTCEPGKGTCTELSNGEAVWEICDGEGTHVMRTKCTSQDPNARMTCGDTPGTCNKQCNKRHIDLFGECTPVACDRDEMYCEGNTVMTCNEDQSAFIPTPCTTNDPNRIATCVEEHLIDPHDGSAYDSVGCKYGCKEGAIVLDWPYTGQCLEVICEQDERQCDGDVPMVCINSGTAWERYSACAEYSPGEHASMACRNGDCVVVCEEPYIQMDGACVLLACAEGEKRCEGDRVMVCNSTGTGYVLEEQCTTSDPNGVALCEDNQCVTGCYGGYININGTCKKRICTPGETKCDGDTVLQCNDTGTEFTAMTCPAPTDANAKATCINGACDSMCDNGTINVNGTCTTPTCTKGQYACNGTWVMVCDESGMNYTKYRTCAVSAYDANYIGTCVNDSECEYHCRDGYTRVNDICKKVICEPGAVSCNGEHTKVQRCNETGTQWVDAETCRSDQLCSNGSCGCTGSRIECDGRCVQYKWDCPDLPCETDMPKDGCVCYAGEWDCPDDPCDEAGKLNDGCACVYGRWDCPEIYCHEAGKTSDACICVDNDIWDCPVETCDEALKTDEDCECVNLNWVCPEPAALYLDIDASSGATTTIQEGEYISLNVGISRKPHETVTVTISGESSDLDYQITPQTLEFTVENWDLQQQVMVLTARDYQKSGDHSLIIKAHTTSSHSIFNGLEAEKSIDVLDIDMCSVEFSPSEDLQTTESGDAQEIEVSLTCRPDSNVIYSFDSDNENEGKIVSDAQFTFTSENWSEPQILRIEGQDDSVLDGPKTYHVTATPETSNPEDFRESVELALINMDDDVGGLNTSDSVKVREGSDNSINISLATQPDSTVTVTPRVDATMGLNVLPRTLTFTTSNYNQPQELTVISTRDFIVTGDRTSTMTLEATSSDSHYTMTKDVTVKIMETDEAGIVFENEIFFDLAMTEGIYGRCPNFHLKTKPLHNVTITGSPTLFNNLYGDPVLEDSLHIEDSVTFTPDNWDQYQCIEMKAPRDGIVPEMDPVRYGIIYSGESEDLHYNNGVLELKSIDVFNVDRYDIVLDNKYPTSLKEGETGYITVSLDAKPKAANIEVSVSSQNTSIVKPRVNKITFNDSNWMDGIVVPFDAINDHTFNSTGERSSYLKFEIIGTADANFSGKSVNSRYISVKDAETPGIQVVKRKDSYDTIDCTKGDNLVKLDVSLLAKPESTEEVLVTQDLNHTLSTKKLTFTPSNYNTAQVLSVKCTTNYNASQNKQKNTLKFTINNKTAYPANPVSYSYNSYPIGFEFLYRNASNSAQQITLVPGKYYIQAVGTYGGGKDSESVGGCGGTVNAEIRLDAKKNVWVYVGGHGERAPFYMHQDNTSGGVGYRRGGKGDWGTKNYSYGGGGATEIHIGDEDHRSIVAGSGGGGTVKDKNSAGKGGAGGCTTANDNRCKATYGGKQSNGATITSGQGEDSGSYKVKGGGGAGYIGGAAGSEKYVGGNGGTSKINVSGFTLLNSQYYIGTKDAYSLYYMTSCLQRAHLVYGGFSNNGCVWIHVEP